MVRLLKLSAGKEWVVRASGLLKAWRAFEAVKAELTKPERAGSGIICPAAEDQREES